MIKQLSQIACLLILLLVSATVAADQHRGQHSNASVSESDAARIIRQQKGGRVLDIKPQRKDGRTHYRVKTLENGRVKVYGVDGRTGKVRD